MKRAGLLLLFLAVTACQPLSSYPVNSPFYQPPSGSQLVLNQPLEIAPDHATVRFQSGKIVQHVFELDTNCVFELRTVKDVAQRVEPDTFMVTKVHSSMSQMQSSAGQPRPGLIKAHMGGEDTGSVRFFFKTEMFLRSERQPQVFMLTCQHGWDPGSDFQYERPPTVAEMQKALGAYFTLIPRQGI